MEPVFRLNSRENYAKMLECCEKYRVPVIVDSDAHDPSAVGRADLAQMGIDREPVAVVVERALAAQAAGIDGVIASGQEAAPIRAATGTGFSIVCPGIRPGGPAGDDQQRTVGVAQAFADGADAIVVGRPIRLAADPRAAALAIQAEIASARQPR